ncbi:MAG: CBS domain-containing protein [Balneolaceae bacterium]|nr:CBS domain-containing protein [Balneolaceae bacterium]
MLTQQALNTEIVPLCLEDSVQAALLKMDECGANTLPVIDDGERLAGQVTRAELEESPGERVADVEMEEAVKVYGTQHVFEAARLMLQYELRLLPVIDGEWGYRGVITKQKVLESLGRMLNLAKQGSVITVQLDFIDFTLSEMVHLIETEGAKILGITVETPAGDDNSFHVSFKLNVEDVSRVASALRRHDYRVATEARNESFGMDMESRADELLRYLDM